MDLGVISVRYAGRSLKSAMDLKQDTQVYKEMQVLAQSYLQVPAFRFTIDNPCLPKTEVDVAGDCHWRDVMDLTKRFFMLVLERRKGECPAIHGTFIYHVYRQQRNIIRGKLTTAVAVSRRLKQR
jgi:F-type H+-transporting ATPase subunit delta